MDILLPTIQSNMPFDHEFSKWQWNMKFRPEKCIYLDCNLHTTEFWVKPFQFQRFLSPLWKLLFPIWQWDRRPKCPIPARSQSFHFWSKSTFSQTDEQQIEIFSSYSWCALQLCSKSWCIQSSSLDSSFNHTSFWGFWHKAWRHKWPPQRRQELCSLHDLMAVQTQLWCRRDHTAVQERWMLETVLLNTNTHCWHQWPTQANVWTTIY